LDQIKALVEFSRAPLISAVLRPQMPWQERREEITNAPMALKFEDPAYKLLPRCQSELLLRWVEGCLLYIDTW
jgi:hypothetical protein